MRNRTSRLRIVVLGFVVRGPLGGLAWHYLQYAAGLSSLGHDVFFVEQSDDYPSCYDPVSNAMGTDPSYGLAFADKAFRDAGVGDCWAFHDLATDRWFGPRALQIDGLCRDVDLCLNISGVNQLLPCMEQIPVRVLVDTDPAFTQIRHLTREDAWRRALQHNVFFTFGENIPSGRALVPDDGLPWQRTRQPILLDRWTTRPPLVNGKFTSVLLWDSYRHLEYGGRRYGQKSESFGPYLDLPRHVDHQFELALGSSSAPADYLRAQGWTLVDPRIPTRDPSTYQAYIQGSKGEFGIAKHGYVVSRTGWFSERTACYLATGRPAIVQDTGFTSWLPCGDGVLPFSTLQEAIRSLDEVNTRYEHHCRAAREVARAYFDANTVLAELVEQAMSSAPSAAVRPVERTEGVRA